MKGNNSENRIVPTGTYITVWLCLLICLGFTIAVSRLHLLASYSVLGSLVIASIKAGLVLAFFMHLKYEGWFLKTMLSITVFALTLLIGLTFADVWLR
jgi:cytochrome c oxidase subunit IV